MALVVLIGASGSGKTTIAREVERYKFGNVRVFYFDQVGVPPVETMVAEFGSGEAWQRVKTLEWLRTLSPFIQPNRGILFEGQTRLSFLAEGMREIGSPDYHPILVDCDDESRSVRLSHDRHQPELANPDMMNWAAFLRKEARETNCEILDTSLLSFEQCVGHVLSRLRSRT